MRLVDIDPEEIVLVKWRDILKVSRPGALDLDDEDAIFNASPVFEIVGKLKTLRRGLAVVRSEWGSMKDYEEYSGEAGNECQILPAGCIEAVYELKIGKRFYKRSEPKDGNDRQSNPGDSSSEGATKAQS